MEATTCVEDKTGSFDWGWGLLRMVLPRFSLGMVKEYEHQIDQMVYTLYGLTEEEIQIVENTDKR